MLAATNVTAIVLLVLGGLLVVLAVAALVLRQRSKGEGPEVPHAMRPGPSDTALETPVLQRLQGWGVVLVVFFVAWWPAQWLFEPGTNQRQEEELHELGVARGEQAVLPFSEENQFGVGCVRCHGPELKGGAIYALGDYWNPPNLTNVCGGPWTGHTRDHVARLPLHDHRARARRGQPDAVVEHPLQGRAPRPADQRHRALPGVDQRGERPLREERVHEPGRGRTGDRGRGHRPAGAAGGRGPRAGRERIARAGSVRERVADGEASAGASPSSASSTAEAEA